MNLEEWLVAEEGFRALPYRCPAGYWTVGIGRNLETRGLSRRERDMLGISPTATTLEMIEALRLRGGVTKGEAMRLCWRDIEETRAALREKLDWFDALSEPRKDALVTMAFQMGVHGLLSFKTTLGLLKEGKYDEAADQALKSKWAKQTAARAKRTTDVFRTGKLPEQEAFA